jgi:hypothetical protein
MKKLFIEIVSTYIFLTPIIGMIYIPFYLIEKKVINILKK